MFKIEVFLLMVVRTMPKAFRGWISSPLKSHLNLTGVSPLLITQDTDAVSPSFNISSPNSKGKICGGTEIRSYINKDRSLGDRFKKPKEKQADGYSAMYR